MRQVLLLAAALVGGAAPALADINSAVAAAIEAVSGTAPTVMFEDQILAQVDGCTLSVSFVEGVGDGYQTAVATIVADFATLDFTQVQRAPVPMGGDAEGVMLLIPTVGMEPSLRETLVTTGTEADFMDAVISSAGTCEADVCEGVFPTPFFRVAVLTQDAQASTDTVLAALTSVGSVCGATVQ